MSHSLLKKLTFGSLPISALPATIMIAVMFLYTIADGVFVSRHVSTNTLSFINIVYPVTNIVLGINVMLFTGSSTIVTKKVGGGRPDSARWTFTTTILLNIGLGLVTVLFESLVAAPLSRLPGASELLSEDYVTYLRWQLASAPALMLQILLQMYFVTEGRPGIGLFLTLLAGVSSALLDYLLIVPLRPGIARAAIATATGYMIPAVIGLLYLVCSRRSLWLVRPRMEREELEDICISGSSEMVTNLLSGIITFLFNLAMMHFTGEDGAAAITIVQYSQLLLNALFVGFSQGVSPVTSFDYGSKNHSQLKQAFRTPFILITVTSLATFLLAQVTGSLMAEVFSRPGIAVYALARHGLITFAFSFLFSGLTISASALSTVLSDGRISVVISFVRTFGLIITSLLVPSFPIGIDGIWLAILIAELGGAMPSIYYMKKLKDVYRYA